MLNNFLPGFLENIFVNAPIGIFTTDLNRVITSANQLAAQIHRLNDGEQLIGKIFPDFICQSSPIRHSQIIDGLYQVFNGTVNRANIEYQLNNSIENKTIRLVSTLLRDEKYTPIGLLNMCEDITSEKKLAEQVQNYTQILRNAVKEKTKELKAANFQLIQSEKLRVLGNLVASVAHEIGNPLCSLEYLMLYVNENTQKTEIRKSIELGLGEIDRLKRLLNRLRELYRSNDGKKSVTSINQLVRDVLQLNRLHLLHKNIRLEKELDEDIAPLFVVADQIKQVFMNIIINAINAMPEGGRLKVVTRQKQQEVLIEFTDTGIGIPKENIDKLFSPFFTDKSDNKSLGLGLSVSNQIIKTTKGKIWVTSEQGKGTSFFITLPLGHKRGGEQLVRQEEEVEGIGMGRERKTPPKKGALI
jgi:signal transduction histidine kinase